MTINIKALTKKAYRQLLHVASNDKAQGKAIQSWVDKKIGRADGLFLTAFPLATKTKINSTTTAA